MADKSLAATHRNVIAFPVRNKGRKRKSNSPAAMGRCSFLLLEREGQSIPKNVTDVRIARAEPAVEESRLALRLALTVFATLNADQKKTIRDVTKMYARHEDDWRGDECRALYKLLTGEQLSC